MVVDGWNSKIKNIQQNKNKSCKQKTNNRASANTNETDSKPEQKKQQSSGDDTEPPTTTAREAVVAETVALSQTENKKLTQRRWIRNNINEEKQEQHEHTQNYNSDEPTAAVEEQCNRSKKISFSNHKKKKKVFVKTQNSLRSFVALAHSFLLSISIFRTYRSFVFSMQTVTFIHSYMH
jgi:hypothetical protein